MLLGHYDMYNVFKDNYCIYYDFDKQKYDDINKLMETKYVYVLSKYEEIIGICTHKIRSFMSTLTRDSKYDPNIIQISLAKFSILCEDVLEVANYHYNDIEKIRQLTNVKLLITKFLDDNEDALNIIEQKSSDTPLLIEIFKNIKKIKIMI